MKKILVIIAARGIGDLIYHLPLLRSLYESYKKKLLIFSNKVNHSKEVYKYELFFEKIVYFDNTRLSLFEGYKAIKDLTKLINSTDADQLILTASPRRLIIPVYLSNIKEKIIFGGGKSIFFKDKQYKGLTHSEKIMEYTKSLNLPIKNNNFFLETSKINKVEENNIIKKLFISLDSHHDQNTWNTKNYIKIIEKIILHDFKIFINFSPKKMNFLEKIPEDIINSKKVFLTHNKSISEIIEIINSCEFVVGNESGPVCLGASLKKEVHSIYIPTHTLPESKIINSKTNYYKIGADNDELIIEKIINSILKV